MKSGICVVTLASTVAALAGCSGEKSLAPAVPGGTQTQVSDHGGPLAVFETLKSARVVVKVQSCGSGAGTATFSAKGRAKGHVRGKFSVSGTWNFYSIGTQALWTFSESFKIKGKHPTVGTITGSGTSTLATCKTFGPASGSDLTYHLGSKSGNATTKELKNGASFLQQMH